MDNTVLIMNNDDFFHKKNHPRFLVNSNFWVTYCIMWMVLGDSILVVCK